MPRNVAGAVLLALVAALPTAESAGQVPRAPFPEFDLVDLNGGTVALTRALGQATVINFWATWCGPCRMELPELQRLSNDFGRRGLVVVAVNLESEPVAAEEMSRYLGLVRPRIESFSRSTNISLPTYVVTDVTQYTLYHAGVPLDRIPSTFLLDAKGRVVRFYKGFSQEAMRDLRQQVGAVLAESSGKGGK